MASHADTRCAHVITNHGNRSVIQDNDSQALLTASARRGKRPVCGDRVHYQSNGTGQDGKAQGDILEVLPRTTELARADFRGRRRILAANLTQLVIVVASKPSTSLALIDRYLVAAEHYQLQAAILLNKTDLLTPQDTIRAELEHYRHLGYPVIESHATEAEGLTALQTQLNGQVSILVGQSGVGKSSLTEYCVDAEHNIRVGALSIRAELGQHTTTATTWYALQSPSSTHAADDTDKPPGAIIDSPGVRDFTLEFIAAQDLESCMREFVPYLGQCRFNNCLHKQEPNCAVLAAVAAGKIDQRRHASYLHMLDNLTELRQ